MARAKTSLDETIEEISPAVVAAVVAEPPVKQVRYRGRESNLYLARSAQNEWVYLAEVGTPYEAVLAPDYWAGFAKKFKPYDRLEVRIEDGSWIGFLRVIDSGLNWTKVVQERDPLWLYEKPFDRAVPIDGHTIKWNGPVDKWTIIRDNDRAKLMANFESREAAMKWLGGHLKALAA